MSDQLSVSIDTSTPVVNPSLEDEAAAQAIAATTPAPAGDRPSWLPDKFKQGEDLAKAYNELEKKLGAPKEPAAAAAPTAAELAATADKATETKTQEESAREVAKTAGVNYDDLTASYWEKGALDDTQYAALAKAGIPKDLVDQYITGQEAVAANTRNAVFESVGGEETYASLIEWAGENYTPAEIAVFNNAVNGYDTTAMNMAVKALKAQHDATVGFEPSNTVNGQTAVKAGTSVYRSTAEVMVDMGDPRYKTDAAFRKDVEQKLGRSDIM